MGGAGFGRQVCGSRAEASSREWLVADGLGGFAMGTVGGLRTRRYHGLLIVATQPPIGRWLALASLDPVLVLGDRRVRLATHEWASGAVHPQGHVHLATFELADGVPRWRWAVGDVVLERELAMVHGSSAVGVAHRLVRSGDAGAVRLELEAWAGGVTDPPPAEEVVAGARRRARAVIAQAGPADETGAALALAADQFVVAGPTVVAGYPWFGDWSRDTMTSYEGLFLCTGRLDEGRALLERAAALVSEGMLANTADVGARVQHRRRRPVVPARGGAPRPSGGWG